MRRVLLLLPLVLAALPAHARDLRNRIGLGFHAQLADVAALSVRYALPTPDPKVNFQVELDAGIEAATGASTTALAGGRLLYGIVAEDNLNLMLGAGAFYTRASGEDGVRASGSIGAQFFLFGLENLGFSAEWGILADVGVDSRIVTVGGAPAVAAHYYF